MSVISRREALKLIGHSLAGIFMLSLPKPVLGFNNDLEIPIQGIYVPGWNGVNQYRIDQLINFLADNQLNTLMIDVKNAHGDLFFSPVPEMAKQIDAQVKTRNGALRSLDLDYLTRKAKEQGIRLIARHVMFADKVLYDHIPEFRLVSGRGQSWVDMENDKVVNYNLELLTQEMQSGFDEIVLDYIRYPDMPGFRTEAIRCTRIDQIVQSVKEVLKGSSVQLGLQLFGYSAWSHYSSNVGQRIETLQLYADTIYPMLYPSHFHKGTMGFSDPNAHPFEMISGGYRAAISKITTDCKIIPMIQGFSYAPEKIAQQILAVKKDKMPGFICWNPSGNHSQLAQALKQFK